MIIILILLAKTNECKTLWKNTNNSSFKSLTMTSLQLLQSATRLAQAEEEQARSAEAMSTNLTLD